MPQAWTAGFVPFPDDERAFRCVQHVDSTHRNGRDCRRAFQEPQESPVYAFHPGTVVLRGTRLEGDLDLRAVRRFGDQNAEFIDQSIRQVVGDSPARAEAQCGIRRNDTHGRAEVPAVLQRTAQFATDPLSSKSPVFQQFGYRTVRFARQLRQARPGRYGKPERQRVGHGPWRRPVLVSRAPRYRHAQCCFVRTGHPGNEGPEGGDHPSRPGHAAAGGRGTQPGRRGRRQPPASRKTVPAAAAPASAPAPSTSASPAEPTPPDR